MIDLEESSAREIPTGGVATAALRAQNTTLLLRILWRERELTRVEIAKRTGLSHSTVSTIVGELERVGLVQSLGTLASRGGRRPQLIALREDVFAQIGVALDGQRVAVALVDLRGRVLSFEEQQHSLRADAEGALATTCALIDGALQRQGAAVRKLLGIGVALPSSAGGGELTAPSERAFGVWRGVDVRALLAARYRLPLFLDNDANLGALAEQWWGAGREATELAYLNVGVQVGAGLILRGELYRGATNSAGEIGHLTIDPEGPPCACGSRGCLSTLVGSEALERRARALYGLVEAPPLVEVLQQAQHGEPRARALVVEAGTHLGVALGTLLHLLDARLVVIGGELSGAGDVLLDAVQRELQKRRLPRSLGHMRVVTSTLGRCAPAIGAATLVLSSALQQRGFGAVVRSGHARA